VDHSSVFSAEVQNEWNYVSAIPACLPAVARVNFLFCFTFSVFCLAAVRDTRFLWFVCEVHSWKLTFS
jgi:hypothetical protein